MSLTSNKDHDLDKPMPLELEFSKLTGTDDSFSLGLTSHANRYFEIVSGRGVWGG